MMAGMVGKKVTMKSLVMCPKKIAAHWTIEGMPEMNSFGIFTEGVENNLNIPMFGGQTKILFNKNAAGDGFDTVTESATYGKWEWSEKYSEAGIEMVSLTKEKPRYVSS